MRRHKLLFIVVILISLLSFFALWYISQQHIVLRVSDGFFPETTYIKKNESIRFINMTKFPSWPASGPHPSHTTYPEFDVQEGIPFLHSWTFTFAKEGTFAFHDHNAPSMYGVVVVGPTDISKVTDLGVCTALPDVQEQPGCAELYYRNVTDSKPFPEAFAIFEHIAVLYPNSCHTFAHDLGKSAYNAYLDGTLPTLGQNASSCGYGLWHGFTTAMQADKGLTASKDFCGSLEGETERLLHANRMNCYHGIGIGLIPDPPPDHLYGKFDPLVAPAVAFCDTVPSDSFYRERCLTGVFHALTIYMTDNLYGFTYSEDTLKKCALLAPQYQRECFITLVAGLPNFTNFDLPYTLDILSNTVPDSLFEEIFVMAAIIFVDADASIDEIGTFVESCEAQSRDLRMQCISAVVNKFYGNGTPGSEYQKATEFCSSSYVYDDEKQECFDQIMSYAIGVYSPEKVALVCEAIPQAHSARIPECSL